MSLNEISGSGGPTRARASAADPAAQLVLDHVSDLGLERSLGQVLPARVSFLMGNKAVLEINKRFVLAETQLPMSSGDQLLVRVRSYDGQRAVLSVVDRKEGAAGGLTPRQDMETLLTRFGLSGTPQEKALATATLEYGFGLDENTFKAMLAASNDGNVSPEELQALMFARANGIPISEATRQGVEIFLAQQGQMGESLQQAARVLTELAGALEAAAATAAAKSATAAAAAAPANPVTAAAAAAAAASPVTAAAAAAAAASPVTGGIAGNTLAGNPSAPGTSGANPQIPVPNSATLPAAAPVPGTATAAPAPAAGPNPRLPTGPIPSAPTSPAPPATAGPTLSATQTADRQARLQNTGRPSPDAAASTNTVSASAADAASSTSAAARLLSQPPDAPSSAEDAAPGTDPLPSPTAAGTSVPPPDAASATPEAEAPGAASATPAAEALAAAHAEASPTPVDTAPGRSPATGAPPGLPRPAGPLPGLAPPAPLPPPASIPPNVFGLALSMRAAFATGQAGPGFTSTQQLLDLLRSLPADLQSFSVDAQTSAATVQRAIQALTQAAESTAQRAGGAADATPESPEALAALFSSDRSSEEIIETLLAPTTASPGAESPKAAAARLSTRHSDPLLELARLRDALQLLADDPAFTGRDNPAFRALFDAARTASGLLDTQRLMNAAMMQKDERGAVFMAVPFALPGNPMPHPSEVRIYPPPRRKPGRRARLEELKVSFYLNVQAMGRMKIDMAWQSGAVHFHFLVSNSEVRDFLAGRTDTLTQRLEQHQVKVGGVGLTVGEVPELRRTVEKQAQMSQIPKLGKLDLRA